MSNVKHDNDSCDCGYDSTPGFREPHAAWCPESQAYREPPPPKNKYKAPKMKGHNA